ncbi:MAG: DHA2 family efflux MFS transporter permease subunit [Chloroflexi bacterium]|nr:DHA2 family efflux MFS transporter permease subunit [Chloroflexota bacterium]
MLERLRSNPWVILIVLLGGFFMILLDSTIVNVAIPSIIDDLHAGLNDILWVTNGYILAYAVLLILFSRFGDMYGQRNLFAAGMVVFIISSAFSGIAQDVSQLIIARVFQGVGGAMLSPQTLAIMTSIFPPERRGAAFGVWGGVAGVATVIGPTLGGFLVTDWSWRWVFYVNLPIGIVALIATMLIVPDLRPGRKHALDPVGVLLVSTGLLAIVFGLIEGESYNWGVIWMWLMIPDVIILGVLLLVAFILWERAQSEALVPLSLFNDHNYTVMNWVGTILSIGMFGIMFVFTIYLQAVVGFSALEAGLVMAPSSVISLFVAPFAGRYSDKIGGKYILMAGLSLFAIGIWVIGTIARADSTWTTFLVPLLIMGLGQGCVFAPQAAIALRNITPRMAGAASGVLNTTRQIGAVIGGAAMGALLQNQLATSLHSEATSYSASLPAAFRGQFVAAFDGFAKAGLHVGRTVDMGSQIPSNLPAALRDQLLALGLQVFNNGYVGAMHASLWLPVVVLIVGVASCLLVKNSSTKGRAAEASEEARRDSGVAVLDA